jgi:predicted phage terminase large subunit-like protein
LNALSRSLRELPPELKSNLLLSFTRHTMEGFQPAEHHKLLCSNLSSMLLGEIKRLMVFMPPRHGKSELVSRRLPALFLGRYPDRFVILTSYAASLAKRMSRDVQRIIDSPAYRELFPETTLAGPGRRSGARRTDEFFEIVGHTGGLRAAGVGGGITGMGFHLGIIDDPFKNYQESHSSVIRNRVGDWYASTFWTRRTPDACILLTMTRWHHDDIAARLLELARTEPSAEQWTVLCMPGLAAPGTVLHPADKRQVGDPLWPERFDAKFMRAARASLGPYIFAGMYQQAPMPEGGHCFKEAWFRNRFRDADTHWAVGGQRYHKSDCPVFITCDPAASEKQSADHTAIAAWAVTPANDLLLLEMARGRLGIDGIVPELRRVVTRWSPGWIAVESNGFQVAIVSAARQVPGMPPIRQLSHAGKGKLVRATPAIILAEAGKLWLPESAPWAQAYITEMLRFTGRCDAEDDQVDATAYAAWQVTDWAPQGLTPDDPSTRRQWQPRDSNAAANGLWGRQT